MDFKKASTKVRNDLNHEETVQPVTVRLKLVELGIEYHICVQCGKSISNGHFCNNDCYHEFMKIYSYSSAIKAYRYEHCCCELCGATDVQADLEVHHIVPRRDFWKYHVLGAARDPDNLIVLCHDCHVQAHRAYKALKRRLVMDTRLVLDRFAELVKTTHRAVTAKDFHRILEVVKNKKATDLKLQTKLDKF